ncbi:trafficking protein particle complex subunit 2 isoform X1 [Aphis craccivora]|uniref:Trafficking protein particle complex subunit 2 isoform X1 n=1 Tax=Aphis craccivora TaxID=307492 RepID=A0A6G0W143_APHCR|nr:trafficking protein particle complex subunit 2 isoform X1 [Aphis craccivora]
MDPIVDKMRENRLRWLRHVLRRENTEAVTVTKNMCVDGKGEEGDRKIYECGLRITGAIKENTKDGSKWKLRTRVADPKYAVTMCYLMAFNYVQWLK